MGKSIAELEAELSRLKAELTDREEALPAHSIRPAQLQLIEELEERIGEIEAELDKLGKME